MSMETLDIDTPQDARKYIGVFVKDFKKKSGKEITYVRMGPDELVHFRTMTDEQAVRIARSMYLDIELPAKNEGKP